MQSLNILGKHVRQLCAGAFVDEQMHIDVHLTEVLKILKGNKRFSTEERRRVLGNEKDLQWFGADI